MTTQAGQPGVTLVVGATGLVGGAVVRLLRQRGVPVRALVRDDSNGVLDLREVGCETARGDLKDAAAVAASCQGVSTVVVTANSMRSRRAGDSIEAVDRQGVLRLIALAQQVGVGAMVYTSVAPTLPPDNPFIRAKREAEEALRSSGLRWTILQPAAFMEIHTGAAAGWHFSRGRVRFAGSGMTPQSFISAYDVAAFAAQAACSATAGRRVLPLGGPEPLSCLDAVRIAERVTGRPVTVQRVPLAVLSTVATVLMPFNPTLGSLLRMIRAGDRPYVADMALLLAESGLRLTTFEAYVRRALAAGR